MKLNLSRPVVFMDIESTGLDVMKDRIVELSMLKVFPNGNEESYTMRFNPEMHISDEASAVNGIYDEDVKDCPTFKEEAQKVADIFKDSDIAGFNSNYYDIPLLVEEFIRVGVSFNICEHKCIDVQNIYHKMEKRTLSAAYRFYCDKDLVDAHTAYADTLATYEVLKAQLDRYEELENNVDFLANFSKRNNSIDLAGRFVYNDKGEEVVNFGKHKGKKIVDVLRSDRGYYAWIMSSDFPQNTKQVLESIKLREGIL